jgi:hypothetical protein
MNQPSNQPSNTNNFQQFRQNCSNRGSPSQLTVPTNLLSVNSPAPQTYSFQSRPASFANGRPLQTQSFILKDSFNQNNQNKSVRMDSYPRKGSIQ